MSYKISIPDVPPSLNKVLRMHWATKRKLQVQWSSLVWLFPHTERLLLRGLALQRARMKVTITLHNARQYDTDNAFGACKMIVDVLRACALLHDDRPEFLDLHIEQIKSTRKEKHTEIEIGPADAS